MRLVLFGEDFKLGVLKGDNIVDISQVTEDMLYFSPQEMMHFIINDFAKYKDKITEISTQSEGVPMNQLRLRAPLPEPARLICMAGNYMESGTKVGSAPIGAFNKSSSSVIGNGDTVILPDATATVFEHEAELAIVIGKTSSKVAAKDAYDHIFGYMNFIDVSCRGIGRPGADNFFIGKSWHTFGPMGPFLLTSDEISDPQALSIKLSVQGDLRQDYNTVDMDHKIPEVIEWITSITTLEAGDVIACGTNHRGLGPLQDQDVIEMEISDFGKLTVNVTDELKRSWVRETHAQKEARESSVG
jgi:2-keto-4-pentenoate hydratase/2-oxohepta-3-ene-1,7-dioic acid hydratase in catechol pathway